jgi:hypothetical protein
LEPSRGRWSASHERWCSDPQGDGGRVTSQREEREQGADLYTALPWSAEFLRQDQHTALRSQLDADEPAVAG